MACVPYCAAVGFPRACAETVCLPLAVRPVVEALPVRATKPTCPSCPSEMRERAPLPSAPTRCRFLTAREAVGAESRLLGPSDDSLRRATLIAASMASAAIHSPFLRSEVLPEERLVSGPDVCLRECCPA